MNVLSFGKGAHQQRIFAKMRHQPQLDLRVIGRDEHISRRRDEGRADLAAQFRLDGNVLQVRIGGRQAPGRGAHLVEGGVDAPFRIGQQRQGINVVGLELGQLPVLQHLARNLVMLRQLFQHIHGGRNYFALAILDAAWAGAFC